MSDPARRRKIAWGVSAISAVIAVAWFVEALTKGRGFISTYLAPIAIVCGFVNLWLLRKAPPPST